MLSVIRHIVRKEFIQVLRDKRMIPPLFLAPIIQLVLFGYAATVDVKSITLAVADASRTRESRELVSSFTQSGYFVLKEQASSPREIDGLLQTGKAEAALVIPVDFGRQIEAGRAVSVQMIIDGTDANTATIIQNYAALIMSKYSRSLIVRVLPRFLSLTPRVEPRIWFNPELKSAFWMVPGIICLVLLVTTLILTSMGITREREMGTLEQLIVSPIKPYELILGKTIPFAIIGFVDIGLILIAGKLVFRVPVRGSLVFLLGSGLVFILTTLGLGLFISTLSRTQGQAMITAIFYVMPAMLLSGIISPIESMPAVIRAITYLNPLRYYGKIVREILVKANGPSILWPDLAVLFAFGVVTIVLSSLRFRKYLE